MNATAATVENPEAIGSAARRKASSGCRPARSSDTELTRLKDHLLSEWLTQHTEPNFERLVKLVATEAEALAWLTPFPLLVLPVLLDEKLDGVQRYARRQRRLLRRRARV